MNTISQFGCLLHIHDETHEIALESSNVEDLTISPGDNNEHNWTKSWVTSLNVAIFGVQTLHFQHNNNVRNTTTFVDPLLK